MKPEPDAGEFEYSFEFERRFRPLLLLMGVAPATSWMRVDGERAKVRFGPWTCKFELSNVTNVSTTGPYRSYRAIGPRGSLEDGGATFGSTTAGGVLIEFREHVSALDLTGTVKHGNLTVTLHDREAVAQTLRELVEQASEQA